MRDLREVVINWADDRNYLPENNDERWKWVDTHDVLVDLWDHVIDPETGMLDPNADIIKEISEPQPYVYAVPLLSEEYCEWLIREAEKSGKWSVDVSDKYAGLEIDLNRLSWAIDHYHKKKIIGYVLQSLFNGLFQWEIETVFKCFLVKYEAGGTLPYMNLHYDPHCRVAVTINLNDPHEYEGGGLSMVRFPEEIIHAPAGEALVFPGGNPMFHHIANIVTEGTRYVLVYWIK